MENKKLAAAMAAVFNVIKTEEEAAALQAAFALEPGQAVAEPIEMPNVMAQSNLWGVSGRQAMMQGGSMMQLRMFK